MVRSVIRDGGGGRSITVSYIVCCRIGWTTFDGGDTCCKCVKAGPKLGDQGVGKMTEATAVIHEVTAVVDQLVCCDLVNHFYLCVQTAEGSISRRDSFIQVSEARAERLSMSDALVQVAEHSISLLDMLI